MYLHHILTRKENALIKKVWWAQVNNPVKGDWCLVVREDLDSIGLSHLTWENMCHMKEEALKVL